jgi:hypothetical protein
MADNPDKQAPSTSGDSGNSEAKAPSPGGAAPSGNAADQAARKKFFGGILALAVVLIGTSFGIYSYGSNRQEPAPKTEEKGSIYLQAPSDEELKTNSLVKVDVYEKSGSNPINALQTAVSYPAEILSLVSVINGTAFPQDVATDTSTPGLVRVARSIKVQTPPIEGTKQIVTLQFRVIKDPTSAVKLSVDKSASLLVRSTDNQNILE